jgi:hypothetical protein
VLYGFLDPEFGANRASWPVLVGLLAGVVVTTVGFAVPTLVMRRLAVGEWGRLRALPLALGVAVGCVVLSRSIEFQPGYLYGLVIGLAFVKEVDERRQGREAATSAILVLAITVACWLLVGVVRSRAGTGFASEAVETGLVTTMVSGTEAIAIGLMPVGGLPGRTVMRWNRKLWAIVWGLSLLLFFHVLINPESGYLVDTALIPLTTTVVVLVGFSVVSVAMWGFFRLRERRDRARLI